ncbi:ThioThioredoxin-like fold [Abeliophyllum distichum]|uniref:ThioThioredoxin-like fold n=1 Tax=Abeliophyllum distichum TaxID=126358 RepID=A0ABD1U0M0_9LAMI
MKELAHAVASDQDVFANLKLMVLYRNTERMLADVLGATDRITILYHHNSFSYKYSGKLRVQNILSSIRYVMSLPPNELPLKSLTTPEELENFLDSTDKAVFLLEFCGWTPRLLTKGKNSTDNGFEGYLGSDFPGENNGTLAAMEEKRKEMGDDKLKCSIDNGSNQIDWLSEFTSVNDSCMREAENTSLGAGVSCTSFEFQHFESFLNRCSKVIRDGDDLRTVLQTQVSPVVELEDNLHEVEPALPAKRPTIFLFIDRSSASMKIRRQSKQALKVFRELAQNYQMLNWVNEEATIKPDKTIRETYQSSPGTAKHPRLQLFPASQKLKDKTSVMIMNDGQQFTLEKFVSDLQGSSLNEILTYALQQKKELKLSSLAKDAGFQLLSEDIDINVVESLPAQSEVHSDQVLREPIEGGIEGTVDLDKNQMPTDSSNEGHEEPCNPSDTKYILLEDKENSLGKSTQSPVESECSHHHINIATESAQDCNVEEKRLSGVIETKQQKDFGGPFFFLDGQYRFLESLTAGLKIPSVVILDPIFTATLCLGLSSQFLSGNLPPYQQSAPVVPSEREATTPPFVNLDFHEADSIPRVTTRTFAELVVGNKSDPKNVGYSWDRNVLVLFSYSWCGFCQRMEVVVREVYRAIKGYADTERKGLRKEKLMLTGEYVDAVSKLPLIYLMDCMQNDCSLILKPKLQRELYPHLLLFPAERKNSVSYDGDITVADIIKFLVAHGSHLLDLVMDKDIVQGQYLDKAGPQTANLQHEILLGDRLPKVGVKYNKIGARFPVNLNERPQVVAGCILTATENLLDVHPFDESKILIVKVDQSTGFQGLITNKHISWDSIEEGSEMLKEAPLSFGGPLVRQGMPLVTLSRKFTKYESIEVLPGVYFLDQWATVHLINEIRVGNQSVHDYWFFLGYSSWGWDQLFHEIAQGAWNVSEGNLEELVWQWR